MRNAPDIAASGCALWFGLMWLQWIGGRLPSDQKTMDLRTAYNRNSEDCALQAELEASFRTRDMIPGFASLADPGVPDGRPPIPIPMPKDPINSLLNLSEISSKILL